MKFMFEIKAEHLVYLNRFVSKEEVRPFIGGICFNLKEKEAVATDGHRLVWGKDCLVCDDEEKPDMVFIKFPRDIISDIKKVKENYVQIKFIGNNDDDFYAVVDWAGTDFHDRTVYVGDSSRYPDYKRLTKDYTGGNMIDEITLNPKQLKDFAYKNGDAVKMTFGENSQSPVNIKTNSKGFDNFNGILMPMRF